MDDALRFTKEVEEFMIEHGFTAEETMYYLKNWYDDPSDIVLTQDKDYWYYNFVIAYGDEEHLHCRFHNKIAFNENDIKECLKYSGIVGCITCNRVYNAKEIITLVALPREDNTKTAVCPYCQSKTVIANYIYGKKRYFDNFEALLHKAHQFWILDSKFILLDKTTFERFY